MNCEVCKNCLKKPIFFMINEFNKDFCLLNGYDKNSEITCKLKSTNLLTVKKIRNIAFNEIMCSRIVPSALSINQDYKAVMYTKISSNKILEDETFNPDESCPYYIEHQLTEWNKNEC